MRISDWSSDVCSSDLRLLALAPDKAAGFTFDCELRTHQTFLAQCLPDRAQIVRQHARPAAGDERKPHVRPVFVAKPAGRRAKTGPVERGDIGSGGGFERSEEHTSELQ